MKGLKVIDSKINEVLCQPGRAVLYNYDGTKFVFFRFSPSNT